MKQGKRIITDTMLGTIGLVVMNAVLSLVVYPFLGGRIGAEAQGKVLFFTSVANLLAGTFGSAANYARLKIFSEKRKTENGDYNIFLLVSFAFEILLFIAAILMKKDTAGATWVGIIIVGFMTTLRYYADVEFRLKLRYGLFCLYYVSIAAGYLLGLLLYLWTGRWVLIFLAGETFGFLFVFFAGTIFRKDLTKTSPDFKKNMGVMAGLALAYVLSDFVGLSDRLLFPLILPNGGDEMTSLYYYASLVGKTMSLLSTPLNGVLMGHLSNKEGDVSRKNFLKITGALLGVFVLVTIVSVIGSNIFVYLFYNDYYEAVKPLFLLTNAGQVLFFVCNTLMVIVLRYSHPRNQLITSVVYIVAFFTVTVPLILKFGIFGMAYGILIVNSLKFILFAVLGFFSAKKEEKTGNLPPA